MSRGSPRRTSCWSSTSPSCSGRSCAPTGTTSCSWTPRSRSRRTAARPVTPGRSAARRPRVKRSGSATTLRAGSISPRWTQADRPIRWSGTTIRGTRCWSRACPDGHAGAVSDERAEERSAERLVVFVDAVGAIAITLLVLPLAEVPRTEEGDPLHAFGDQLALDLLPFFGFAVSFYVVA